MSCRTCHWWQELRTVLYADSAGRGRCRAVHPTTTAGGLTVWPLTHGDEDWCAGWTERQQQPAELADQADDFTERFFP